MLNLEKYSNIFKALGEPNRLAIVLMLKERKMCVCEIVTVLPVSFSTISSHLKILLNAGIVEKERDGKWIVYSLTCDKLIQDIVETVSESLKSEKGFGELMETIKKLNRDECALNYKEI